MLDFDYIGTREWFTDGEGVILRVDGQLPSLNDYIGKCRANPYKGAKFKAETEEKIRWEIRKNSPKNKIKINPEKYPVKIEILWIEKDRRRDVDNVKSAVKYILDALKGDVLEDDSPRYVCQIVDKVVYDKAHPGVRVKIIEKKENDMKTDRATKEKVR